MLEFTKLTLADIRKIRPYFPYSKNKICDNTVGSAFMWRDYFEVEYAEHNDTVIFKAVVKYHNSITAFSPPLGKDYRGSIEAVVEYCRHHGLETVFYNATEDDLTLLGAIFNEFQAIKYEDWSDYLYRAADLVTLAGRKFSGQRNHINYFKKAFEGYAFEEITNDNIADVIEFYDKLTSRLSKDSNVYSEEQAKTVETLVNFSSYGLLGGMIRVNGSIVAFSLGEIVNNVLFIHVEKADTQYRGAYQVINNEFAKHFCSDGVEFINREEDVGDEGLRTSKKSYHPYRILDKHIFITH